MKIVRMLPCLAFVLTMGGSAAMAGSTSSSSSSWASATASGKSSASASASASSSSFSSSAGGRTSHSSASAHSSGGGGTSVKCDDLPAMFGMFERASPNRGIDVMSDHVAWDKKLRGFGLRTRNGKRTWIYQYKFNGKNRRLKLGDGELPRDQARMLAEAEKGKLASAKLGHRVDPATERDQRRADAQAHKPAVHSLGATVPKYLAARDAKLRPTTKRAIKMYLDGDDVALNQAMQSPANFLINGCPIKVGEGMAWCGERPSVGSVVWGG
jgi:hypothetical protein